MMVLPTPPTDAHLLTLLHALLPPSLPLPPQLLSFHLKTRHLYLPPSPSSPDSYLTLFPSPSGSTLVDLLRRLSDLGNARRGPLEYKKQDEETLLVRFRISGNEDLGGQISLEEAPIQTDGLLEVQVVMIWQEADDTWTLYDTTIPTTPTSSTERWSSSIDTALQSFDSNTVANAHDDDDFLIPDSDEDESTTPPASQTGPMAIDLVGGGAGHIGDPRHSAADFWGDYSDDEDENEKIPEPTFVSSLISKESIVAQPITPSLSLSTPVPPQQLSLSPLPSPSYPASGPPSRAGSIALDGDDYWGRYGNVEDGLANSRPPSPGVKILSGFGVGVGAEEGAKKVEARPGAGERKVSGKGYWGTGGETPVGWSPIQPNHLSLPPTSPSPSGTPPTLSHSQTKQPTDGPGTINLASPPVSPNPNEHASAQQRKMERQEKLEKALMGVYELYVGVEGEEEGRREEFREVVGRL